MTADQIQEAVESVNKNARIKFDDYSTANAYTAGYLESVLIGVLRQMSEYEMNHMVENALNALHGSKLYLEVEHEAQREDNRE